MVGNHPAARVIASLRRSAAIVVSCCYPLAVALPTVSSAGFSYRVSPSSSSSPSRFFSSLSLSLARSLRFSRQHRPAYSVSFSYCTGSDLALFRSDDGSGSSSSLEQATWLPFIYQYTEYGYPLAPLPRARSPRHPASHRLRHPTPSFHPFCLSSLPFFYPASRATVAFATVEAEFNYFISPYTDQRRRRRCRRLRRCQPRAESDVSRRRLLAPSTLTYSHYPTSFSRTLPSYDRRTARPRTSSHPLPCTHSVSRHPFPSGGSCPSPCSTFPPTLLLLTFLHFHPILLLHLRATVSVRRHFVVALRASNLAERGDFITSHFLPASAFPRTRRPFVRRVPAFSTARRGNTGRFANLICCLRGRRRTLTCFQFSVTERAKNNIRARGIAKCGKRNGNVTFVSERSARTEII